MTLPMLSRAWTSTESRAQAKPLRMKMVREMTKRKKYL